MTIGQRIKQRRKELGLTQTDLAHRLGNKSKVSVCTVENDKEDLTTDRIMKYAKALECTPAYLMGWVASPNEKQINIYDLEGDEVTAEEIRKEQFERRFKYEMDRSATLLTTEESVIIECYRELQEPQKEMVRRMISYYEKAKEGGIIK